MNFIKKVLKIISYVEYSVDIQSLVDILNDIDKNKDKKITIYELIALIVEKLGK